MDGVYGIALLMVGVATVTGLFLFFIRPTFPLHDPLRSAVLVTGTSSGLGRAIALALAALGYRKVYCGVRRESDAPTEYSTCVPLVLDVSDPKQIANAVAAVEKQLAADVDCHLVAIIMNAGITAMGPLETIPMKHVREAFEVNVFGLLSVVQAFLPLLRVARGGRVVLVGSEAGMISPVFYGAYAATKHAVEALADSLRGELLPSGVAVSLLQVGSCQTAIEVKMRAQLHEGLMPSTFRAAEPFYERRLRRFLRIMDGVVRLGLLPPASAPTSAVLHALGSRRPHSRYLIGLDTWCVWAVVRHLPESIVDRVQQLLL